MQESLTRRSRDKKLGHKAFSFLGKRCRLCGNLLDCRDQVLDCCSTCLEGLPMRKKGFCPGCGQIYEAGKSNNYCSSCLVQSRPWSSFAFYGPYEGFLRDLILNFKFTNHINLRAVLAAHLFESYKYHLGHKPLDLIVPVPLHKKRLAERGFNQSLELAKLLGDKLTRKVASKALKRIRSTPPQSALLRQQRLLNLQGAIRADKNLVQGKNILLVDDICTTGTTLMVCAKNLLEAGCYDVQVIVLARAY